MPRGNTIETNYNSYLRNNFNPKIASRKSNREIWDAGASNGQIFEKGKMYVMVYQTPDEEFYDQMPIVLSMGWLDSNHIIGLNIHYIDPRKRIPFIKHYIQTFLKQIEKSIQKRPNSPDKQSQNNYFTYDVVSKTYISTLHLEKAVHVYRIDRIKKIICLPYEKWHLGMIHNENYFVGGTISDAQGVLIKSIKLWKNKK